jgi:hypothetical protein
VDISREVPPLPSHPCAHFDHITPLFYITIIISSIVVVAAILCAPILFLIIIIVIVFTLIVSASVSGDGGA